MKKKDSCGKFGQKALKQMRPEEFIFFETKETAEKYLDMHSKKISWIWDNRYKCKDFFAINEQLTKITHGPLN
ncbi:hypothetical protein GCM10020331_000600 [Ectobacillus funiculus]